MGDNTLRFDTAVLVTVVDSTVGDDVVEEHLDELAFLAETANIKAIKRFVQRLAHPEVRYFVGSGKLQEIKEFASEHQVGNIIFDEDLSPSQLRNLEKEFNSSDSERTYIFDRSLLILDIFKMRARTAHARTQVELAMNQYLLPRLTRMWTHLERQRGGTGTRGGAGEKEIETDRRNIRQRISILKDELKKIDRQMTTQRKSRNNNVRVALVGYTNAGKSTLMNLLSKSDVVAENKLFATVDSTVRKVVLKDIPFLLSDTVGFIRKLPHHVIDSFKSTLDEVREASLLIHVVDVSHAFHGAQIEVVSKTLTEIGAGNIPVILVLNKIDKISDSNSQNQIEGHYHQLGFKNVVFISATSKQNISGLKEIMFDMVMKEHMKIYPHYLKPNF